ncbi:MAG: Uma2 family endonuclease [Ardenticatenales bacterium]
MTVSPTLQPSVSTAPPSRRGPARLRFDVDLFVRFCEAELPPDARVELIDGVIYQMSPTSPEHNGPSISLTRLLVQRLGDLADVLPSSSIVLSHWSMPQPDFVVLARHDDPTEYHKRHIEPADCLLIVEVSRSSLRFDRGIKARAYARAGVPEYWVVAVDEGVIEVHREPRTDGKGYASVVRHGRGETVAPGAFADVRIGVDEVLGPTRG